MDESELSPHKKRKPVPRWARFAFPNYEEMGVLPLALLAYLLFLFLPRFQGYVGVGLWLEALAIGVFLPLYFQAFRQFGPRVWPYAVAIACIGYGVFIWHPGGMVFVIYACSFAAFAGRSSWQAVAGIAGFIGIGAWIMWWQGFHVFVIVVMGFMGAMVGISNTFFSRYSIRTRQLIKSREETRRMASEKERERIARDLHDLLGHTLSVIALKAEAARKLMAHQHYEDSAEHLQAVEDISRQALSQVRTAVAGFRSGGVRAELDQAHPALQSVGTTLHAELSDTPPNAALESVLAHCLRELLMNVVRHAGAKNVWVSLRENTDGFQLQVRDDGVASHILPGEGIRGLKERIASVQGDVSWNIQQPAGLLVTLQVPAHA